MACLVSLYRLYDDKERLLYVGISKNFIARLGQHENDKDWSGKIVTAKIEYYVGEQAARNAEKKAISDEKPIHNISRPSMGGCRIITVSINDKTDAILNEIKKLRINKSGLICDLLAAYAANDFRIPVPGKSSSVESFNPEPMDDDEIAEIRKEQGLDDG